MSFELVTIRVGTPPVDFPVYKDIICSVPYFNAAFNRGFREATEAAITLPDMSEPIFRIFVQWCHSQMHTSRSTAQAIVPDEFLDGSIKSEPTQDEKSNSSGDAREPSAVRDAQLAAFQVRIQSLTTKLAKDDGDAHLAKDDSYAHLFDQYRNQVAHVEGITDSTLKKLFYENEAWLVRDRNYTRTMAQLYIFADKYSVPQLSDDIISAMMGFNVAWSAYPDPEISLINLIYANLPRTALLIRYIVLNVAYYWTTDFKTHSVEEMEQPPPQYLVDAMVAQAERQNSRRKLVAGHPQCETLPDQPMDCLSDSCAFHEYLVHDRVACRRRLVTGPIEGCMKEAKKLSAGTV